MGVNPNREAWQNLSRGAQVDGTVTVTIPHGLRDRTQQKRQVQVTGTNVRQLVDALERDYPGLGFNLRHETGELRPYVNIFVGQENIRYLQGLDTPVEPGDTVHILHSVAGG